MALTSGLIAAPFHNITISKEHVALHNNQIFIQLDGEWVPVEEMRFDGKRLYRLGIQDPYMSRCSKVDVDFDIYIQDRSGNQAGVKVHIGAEMERPSDEKEQATDTEKSSSSEK